MEKIRHNKNTVNIGSAERWCSAISGGLLAASGLQQGRRGAWRVAAGALLLQRALTGHCRVYKALGVHTAPSNATIPYQQGIRVRAAVTINQPRERVYSAFRDFTNLPRFMRHLESVEELDSQRSRWTAKGPGGKSVTWEAAIIGEVHNERISWKSLPESDVASAGTVTFKDAPGGRGVEVRVELQYDPPAGAVGAFIARLFGKEPEQEISKDLRYFKQLLETDEIASTQGQPQGGWKSVRLAKENLEEAIA